MRKEITLFSRDETGEEWGFYPENKFAPFYER